ncbi:MAG: type II toxin-antitoxin system VapC family toxin [Syntrophothermus sp.]|uniref:type II toxin-antitoxin system VapC family toxin n=1 Tax=Syntrophothermus sp. TaxID=2736299 RepID=UPI00257C3535|nr:type II toxin-antitoxin system VapC family toxin [Syntrophothermus sp.]NSW84648.1 type II toxin-antitoxin system VapC family toxin [Syntrophothermus sp.]
MNGTVFIDTAGWLALINRKDQLHAQAVDVYRSLGKVSRITTDAILVETCNALSKPSFRHLAVALIEKVREAEQLRVLRVAHVTKYLLEQAWELFRERPDKEWSLTDCISFIVMRRHRCSRAFTSDRHFEQAGFKCLLQS